MAMAYVIEDRTPTYFGYSFDEDGYIKLKKNKKGVICLDERCFHKYGKHTWGLLDGSKIRTEDWESLRRECWIRRLNGEWKHYRFIGGSDAGVVCGTNQWKTAEELRLEKAGIIKPEFSEETEYKFEIGHALEEIIAKGFYNVEKENYPEGEFKVFKDRSVFFNIRFGFMQANVDFFCEVYGKVYILEIKSSDFAKYWFEDGIPEYYKSQALDHYPMVLEDFHIQGTYFAAAYNFRMTDIVIVYEPLVVERMKWTFLCEKKFMEYLNNGKEIPNGVFAEAPELVEKSIAKKYPIANDNMVFNVKDKKTIEACKEYIQLFSKKSKLEKEVRLLNKELKPLKNLILEKLKKNGKGSVEIDGIPYTIKASNKTNTYWIPNDKVRLMEKKEPGIFAKLLSEGIIVVTEGRDFSIKEDKIKEEKKVRK